MDRRSATSSAYNAAMAIIGSVTWKDRVGSVTHVADLGDDLIWRHPDASFTDMLNEEFPASEDPALGSPGRRAILALEQHLKTTQGVSDVSVTTGRDAQVPTDAKA